MFMYVYCIYNTKIKKYKVLTYIHELKFITFELSKTSTASSSSKMFPGAESICKILFSTSNNALAFSAPSTINCCLFDSKSGLRLKKYNILI